MPAALKTEDGDAEHLFNPLGKSTQRKRVEYWSKTYRKWIPAEISAVDHKDCAVQVNVKPGVWLSCSDWDKKLRVAVYEVPHGDYDRINEPQFHEAMGKECENMNVLQLNDLYPNCPLDRIAHFLDQDTVKGHEPSMRPHEAEDTVARSISGFADITRPASAKVAREEDAEHRQDGQTATRPELSSREASLEEVPVILDNYGHHCQLATEHVAAASGAVNCTEHADEHTVVSATQDGTPKEQLAKDEAPRGHIERRSSDPLEANYMKPKTRILGYCCPKCGEGSLASLHEAVQHCRNPEEPVCVAGEGIPCVETACAPLIQPILALPGEPVAYNSCGQPVIARQVDPETGTGRTMVLNDDGSCDVFGQQTIASLLSSTETEADDWIEALSDYQLRGLVHEMGQRLLETSHVYQARLSQWEHLSEKANLAFFGLSEDATDRELDLAYRQLSKKLHPDKNGGTEESKQRFQEMKTRYEALKKKRGEQEGDEKKETTEEQTEDQDEEQSKEKDERTIEFDPTNRESLHGTFKKMHSQLSTLDSSMANLVRQLKRHGL